jgi:hypothetical protein
LDRRLGGPQNRSVDYKIANVIKYGIIMLYLCEMDTETSDESKTAKSVIDIYRVSG